MHGNLWIRFFLTSSFNLLDSIIDAWDSVNQLDLWFCLKESAAWLCSDIPTKKCSHATGSANSLAMNIYQQNSTCRLGTDHQHVSRDHPPCGQNDPDWVVNQRWLTGKYSAPNIALENCEESSQRFKEYSPLSSPLPEAVILVTLVVALQ